MEFRYNRHQNLTGHLPITIFLDLRCKIIGVGLLWPATAPFLRNQPYSSIVDLLHLQGLPFILASTCCKAIFRSSFGPSRRDLAGCQRIPIHIFYRRDLENDGMVQMKCEKPLCGGWKRISTSTRVNAKGLVSVKYSDFGYCGGWDFVSGMEFISAVNSLFNGCAAIPLDELKEVILVAKDASELLQKFSEAAFFNNPLPFSCHRIFVFLSHKLDTQHNSNNISRLITTLKCLHRRLIYLHCGHVPQNPSSVDGISQSHNTPGTMPSRSSKLATSPPWHTQTYTLVEAYDFLRPVLLSL